MRVVIECRDSKVYQFLFPFFEWDTENGLFIVHDREDNDHFFPIQNVIHVSVKQET